MSSWRMRRLVAKRDNNNVYQFYQQHETGKDNSRLMLRSQSGGERSQGHRGNVHQRGLFRRPTGQQRRQRSLCSNR